MSTGHANGHARNGNGSRNGNGHAPHLASVAFPEDRLPPQNIEAEQGVLGAILLDNSVLPDVASILKAGDFYRDDHQVVYRAIRDLHDAGKPVDALILREELGRRGEAGRIGADDLITELLGRVPHSANARFHAEIVAQKAAIRALIGDAREIIEDGYSGRVTADELLARAEEGLGRVAARAAAEDDEPAGRAWPAPIAEAAYHGVAGRALAAIAPHTEADPAAVLVQFLVLAGNLVGRGPHAAVESTRHGCNLFAAVVGNSSKARKGTSWNNTLAFVERVDAVYVADHVVEGLSSGEGLIDQVRDMATNEDGVQAGVEDKRLMVVESEFGATLGISNREGNSLSGIMRRAWDSGNLRTLTRRKNQVRTTGAHISIIGHVTNEELERRLTNVDAANGFANRFLWACARRSKYLPEGGRVVAAEVESVSRHLRDIVRWIAGEDVRLHRTPDAAQLWRDVYPKLSEPRPGMLGVVTSRAEAQVLRLSSIYAVLDGTREVDERHLCAALAVWRYCEASAAYIFGHALGDPDGEKLLQAIRDAGAEGITRKAICHQVFGRHKSAEEIDAILDRLARIGLVESVAQSTGGRPVTRWLCSAT